MNILLANWTWYPSGGEWTYAENISKLYEQKGHKVIPFSMKDDRNYPSEYSDYFIENIDYKKIKRSNIVAGLQVMIKSIYSAEAQRNLKRLLNDVRIDFAHLNVIHHYITPTILKILKERNIPVIWTMNEYTPICPDSIFVSHGNICEKCYGGAFYNCITNKCKKGSVLASTVAAMENYVHTFLNYYALTDYYICPSEFSYNKFKSFNFFPEKLVQLYHTFDYSLSDAIKQVPKDENDKYIVFVGRLEKIKGLHTVLKAMINHPDIKLKVVGSGGEEEGLKQFVVDNNMTNITFLGKKSKKETFEIVNGSEFLICPSECYEVLGFTIVEAMALGKPVLGAAIGGIPETVIDDYTGFLFSPGNHAQLAEFIGRLYYDNALIERLGENAYQHIRQLINAERHFEGLKKLIPQL